MLSFTAFQAINLMLVRHHFLPGLRYKQGKICVQFPLSLGLPGGDGSAAPRRSLEQAGMVADEKGKGSCSLQGKHIYFQRAQIKDLTYSC